MKILIGRCLLLTAVFLMLAGCGKEFYGSKTIGKSGSDDETTSEVTPVTVGSTGRFLVGPSKTRSFEFNVLEDGLYQIETATGFGNHSVAMWKSAGTELSYGRRSSQDEPFHALIPASVGDNIQIQLQDADWFQSELVIVKRGDKSLGSFSAAYGCSDCHKYTQPSKSKAWSDMHPARDEFKNQLLGVLQANHAPQFGGDYYRVFGIFPGAIASAFAEVLNYDEAVEQKPTAQISKGGDYVGQLAPYSTQVFSVKLDKDVRYDYSISVESSEPSLVSSFYSQPGFWPNDQVPNPSLSSVGRTIRVPSNGDLPTQLRISGNAAAEYKVVIKEVEPELISDQVAEGLAEKGGCIICHESKFPIRGPTWSEISKRYARSPNARQVAVDRVFDSQLGDWLAYRAAGPGRDPHSWDPDRLRRNGTYDTYRLIAWVLNQPPAEEIYLNYPVADGTRTQFDIPKDAFVRVNLPIVSAGWYVLDLNTENYTPFWLVQDNIVVRQFARRFMLRAGEKTNVTLNFYSVSGSPAAMTMERIPDKMSIPEVFDRLKTLGCADCHSLSDGTTAPSWKEVISRYRDDPDRSMKWVQSIRDGSSGAWASAAYPSPMSALSVSDYGDHDLQVLVKRISELLDEEELGVSLRWASESPVVAKGEEVKFDGPSADWSAHPNLALQSVSGDADLFLFDRSGGPGRRLIGVSQNRSGLDVLQLPPNPGGVEIVGFGHSESQVKLYQQ